eukprot:4777422-Pleurochrysis_carterae.AAC.3
MNRGEHETEICQQPEISRYCRLSAGKSFPCNKTRRATRIVTATPQSPLNNTSCYGSITCRACSQLSTICSVSYLDASNRPYNKQKHAHRWVACISQLKQSSLLSGEHAASTEKQD